MKTTGPDEYFRALQEVFKLESRILTHVIPHSGERGKNDELRLQQFLTRVLPRRFSVGTGFVVCSDPSVGPSAQTDVVVFDEMYNTPLHRELSAFLYPVETVYAVIEVKGELTEKEMQKALKDVSRIRRQAEHKQYVQYSAVQKPGAPLGQHVTQMRQYQDTLPPRAFVFAYEEKEKKDWKTLEDFRKFLEQALTEESAAHLHGVAVLSKGWYCWQEAFCTSPTVHAVEGDCLLRFTSNLLDSINSFPMRPCSSARYFRTLSRPQGGPPDK